VLLHSTSKTSFGGGGLGLGLPICKGIVEAHGGQIWVESDGKDAQACPGSEFFVVLPMSSSNVGKKVQV
jgi:signal transduction histidine kinase